MLFELANDMAIITKGQKIAYLADVRFSKENMDRFRVIAEDADTLFIEAYYLDEMKDEAYTKAHLTAAEAGVISRDIRAKKIAPMHISPRYHKRVDEVFKEAGCIAPGLK